MKQCRKCGEEKDLSEFFKDRSRKDGLQSWCKACRAAHCKTPRGRESAHRYITSDKGLANEARRRRRDPEKRAARSAVTVAVRDNRIPPPSMLTCECGEPAQEFHHFAGYDEPNWFNVNPMCSPCHKKEHLEAASTESVATL